MHTTKKSANLIPEKNSVNLTIKGRRIIQHNRGLWMGGALLRQGFCKTVFGSRYAIFI
jgi:hypothetical protein